MATITQIQLQNGQIYDLPSGGGTYTLSISGDVITLTGSGGDTSSVTVPDDDTTYTISISGHSLTLTPSSGSAQTVTLPDNDTTYTLSISGDVLTLTPSTGTAQTVTIPILKYTKDAPDSPTTNNVVQNNVAANVANGGYSIAEGNGTEASGIASHAEGEGTVASGGYSHAEGNMTEAVGISSHAEGERAKATGLYSHAESDATEASGFASHAEGNTTTASGSNSHSEGKNTVASGINSHAQNEGTEATKQSTTVIGTYNEKDTSSTTTHPSGSPQYGKYGFIMGNGTDANTPGNAMAVTWDGDIEAAGDIEDGNGNVLANKVDASSLAPVATSGDYDDLTNKPIIPPGVSPATATPLMDGTGAVGTSVKFAREDHVHPSDTSKQDTLVSGTNIKTINGNSLLGSGDIGLPQIRKGYVSLGSVPANSYKDTTVTFDSALPGKPAVLCSMVSTSTSPTMGSISVSPINVSASGFTCRAFNNTNAARSPGVEYIAIYE